jgi:hypothetical protein
MDFTSTYILRALVSSLARSVFHMPLFSSHMSLASQRAFRCCLWSKHTREATDMEVHGKRPKLRSLLGSPNSQYLTRYSRFSNTRHVIARTHATLCHFMKFTLLREPEILVVRNTHRHNLISKGAPPRV